MKLKKRLQQQFWQSLVAQKLKRTLLKNNRQIPVIIVSYNNGAYVENIVSQMNRFDIIPIVIDNKSTHKKSLQILCQLQNDQKADIVFSPYNFGHLVGFTGRIYEALPEVFAYSNPDLELSPDLPHNFLEILADLTKEFSVYKAGCALSMPPQSSDNNQATQFIHRKQKKPFAYPQKPFTPAQWEKQFWRFKIEHPIWEVYAAKLDTTFAVYRKSNYQYDFLDAVRVAGVFTAVHLPWFPESDIMCAEDKLEYFNKNESATWKNQS
ncbi:glycosyltransferase family 2 protein [Neisseria dumasiana]|uniref:Glycosyltransferase 2-like domain-containing protein n=1 Tax=Neisseria dumasiana TaxID=1931275 RepID=A0A1X3DFA9_9NEIS|nr:glycosyltransferase [Neisseria dumasiana]OSI18422.1 hypothetical protein BV912_09745 [Neisseria dumasiana]